MILPHMVQSPLLREVPGVYHAFLGIDPVEGREDRGRLAGALSIPPEAIGRLKQVHSADVLAYVPGDGNAADGPKREGDALWTATCGTGAAVRTADCVPILVAHRRSGLVAAVHAGWRGLSAGIVEATIRAVAARLGEESVKELVAAAGPCARRCCYEIGEETADALAAIRGVRPDLRKGQVPGKWFADLQAIALSTLAAAGVPGRQAEGVGPCTVCSPRFHSFRREKSLTGRQLSLIYLYRSTARNR
jgi:purine-nucleoside/S-methyl-5'-thioadenosine phosphorylase / adenosine deaminase